MADFTNKKIRTFFENELRDASAEDLALLIAVSQPLLASALERIKQLSTAQGVTLEPLQDKPKPAASPDGKAKV